MHLWWFSGWFKWLISSRMCLECAMNDLKRTHCRTAWPSVKGGALFGTVWFLSIGWFNFKTCAEEGRFDPVGGGGDCSSLSLSRWVSPKSHQSRLCRSRSLLCTAQCIMRPLLRAWEPPLFACCGSTNPRLTHSAFQLPLRLAQIHKYKNTKIHI